MIVKMHASVNEDTIEGIGSRQGGAAEARVTARLPDM